MAARPLPPPEPGQTSKKVGESETGAAATKQPFLETIRTVANGPALRRHLNTIMKKRWLRIVGIAVAVFLVTLIALPFLINVNSFRPKIQSEASSALGRQVTVGNLSLSILSGSVGGGEHCDRGRSRLQQVVVHHGEIPQGGRRTDATHLLEAVESD